MVSRLNLFGVPLVDGENYHGLREPYPHQALGNSPHHCAGAHLSRRTVGVILLSMLFERFPNMTLPDPRASAGTVCKFVQQSCKLRNPAPDARWRHQSALLCNFSVGSSFVDPYGPPSRERHLQEAFPSLGRNLVRRFACHLFCGESACLHTRGSRCHDFLTFNLDL